MYLAGGESALVAMPGDRAHDDRDHQCPHPPTLIPIDVPFRRRAGQREVSRPSQASRSPRHTADQFFRLPRDIESVQIREPILDDLLGSHEWEQVELRSERLPAAGEDVLELEYDPLAGVGLDRLAPRRSRRRPNDGGDISRSDCDGE